MPIDVNSYNAQFRQFVQFAERQMQAGKAKAFAFEWTASIKPGANVDPKTRVAISDNANTFQFTFIGEMYAALTESLGVYVDDAPWDVDKKTPVSQKSVNAIFDTIKEYTLDMQERRNSLANPA